MSMNLEEIMKPYFEKKDEINKNYEARKNSLKLQLEKIRDNKDSEIAEYLQNAVLDGRDFYSGYSAMIKEDLERAYAQKEIEIEEEINNVDKYYRVDVRELIELKGEMRKSLIAAKKELELKIMEAKINFDTIMFKLKTFKYEYDENHKVLNGNEFKELYEQSNILIELKYGYEEQLKKLEEYFQMTELTPEEIKIGMMSMTPWEKEEYDRRKSLKVNEEVPQFDLVETLKNVAEEKEKEKREEEEEKEKTISTLSGGMPGPKIVLGPDTISVKPELEEEIPFSTSDEKEIEEESFEEPQIEKLPIEDEIEEIEEIEEFDLEKIEEELNKGIDKEIEKEQKELTPEEIISNDLIDSTLNFNPKNVKFDQDYNVVAETYNDLLYHIFAGIADEAKKMRAIKIDQSKGELASNSRYISTSAESRDGNYEVKGKLDLENSVQLPSGEYLNQKDLFKAIDKYRKHNKGRSFTVNGKEYEINRKTAKQLKKALKECSTITLLKEKKITEFDMKRMVGKNLTEDGSKVELGRVETDLKTGNYINAEEFLGNLRNLFEEKKTSWFKKTVEKFNSKKRDEGFAVIDSETVEEIEESNKSKTR